MTALEDDSTGKSELEQANEFELALRELVDLKPFDAALDERASQSSAATMAAVGAMAQASPAALQAIRSAANNKQCLQVVFNPQVTEGLRNGTFQLLQTSTGQMATAVKSNGHFVANARVVGDAAKIGKGVGLVSVAGATAVAVLPLVIAGAAAYQQQQQLERALGTIQSSLDRIEQLLMDADHGVCDAAEQFLEIAGRATQNGGLPSYFQAELATHRVRVEGLYAAKKRWVERFKRELERQQIEWEAKKGERQPWVDQVGDLAKDGKLAENVLLFVRSLVAQARLDALAAFCLAQEGEPQIATQLLFDSAVELRSQFFDLHNRLRPLAAIAPPKTLRSRVPLLERQLDRAHEVAQLLVRQLNEQVLPGIPNPHHPQPVVIELSSDDVRELSEASSLGELEPSAV